ncbi:ECF sigma factor [Gemmata sp. SH-PL17]|uniref:ECF-type sigma factor n=1 Tax=Gemmata sp. SH-PL17 TaxID=1630693 RepID=UPI0004B1B4EC|nr:ECF-type sigma factor [Gemmata sp. SH-PL17]AMV27258.1 ECF sigma factor [Gemmata sp. SH-PL17]
MSAEGSITRFLGPLRAGDEGAVQKLWEAYYERLVSLARKKLGSAPRRAADEEDAALSAFDNFCRGAVEGRFPRLLDRDDLWQILLVLTVRKTANLLKRENALKRGGRAQPIALSASDANGDDTVLAELIDREPEPGVVVEVAEECRRLLEILDDPELRAVAVWKMEGHTNEEIAAKLGRSLGSVERKLRVIRTLWGQELPP